MTSSSANKIVELFKNSTDLNINKTKQLQRRNDFRHNSVLNRYTENSQ